MKKVTIAVSFVSLLVATSAYALNFTQDGATNVPGQGVNKSKHNMLLFQGTVKDGEGRVCAYCHTPHHALAAGEEGDYMPLWSHTLLNTAQRAGYTPYKTATFDAGTDPLAGPTLLCMSCHDGLIAVDQHYGVDGVAKLNDDSFAGDVLLGGGTAIAKEQSLSNDHPIGFSYTAQLTTRGADLEDVDTVFRGGTKTIGSGLYGTNKIFTCASCHDVHNKDNVKNTNTGSTRNYFLLGDNNQSRFCLTCHKKGDAAHDE